MKDFKERMLNKGKSSQIYNVRLMAVLAAFSILLTSGIDIEARHDPPIQKLDPVLRLLIIKQELNAAPSVFLPMMHLREPDVINAIIKVSGNPTAIESAGARVRSVTGSIVTADVPLRSLKTLINLSNVVYVQAARQMQPVLMDVSVPDTGADQVWRSVPGYTGKGVIVGIIDSGIYWKHPDFTGADGTSRILYIWDQTVQTFGQHPAGYEYGTEWTKAHIDSGQCQEMDASGHGTHVASIIAGDGRGRHKFTGMAPEADIIAVKAKYMDADILDAANYIFQKAEELNRPAIINMSFGYQWGPHDGTTLLDQGIDELLDRPGRAIVAAAGNNGDSTDHVGASSLRRPVSGNYPWTAIQPSVGAQIVMVQIWYDPAKFLSVRFLLPENDEGDLSDLDIGWVSEGRFSQFSVPKGPLAGAEVVIEARLKASEFTFPNFDGIYVYVFDNGDPTIPVDDYVYAIEYDGPGTGLDAYVVRDGSFTTDIPGSVSFPDRSFLLEGDGDKTIVSPSSASRVICAGSYATKSEWIDSENRVRTEEMEIDDISIFSSRGPLLNGDRKPDIAAPGEMITAAFSADSWGITIQDGQHVVQGGTSMASPHVAGAVALIYQQNPRLTALEMKETLTRTAIDRGPAGWDEAWGYGKLDVLAAMDIPSAPRSLEVAEEGDSITVTWLSGSENDIAGYRIYSTLDDVFSILNSPTPSIEYQASSIKHQITLSVSAYDTDGNEGPRSQKITITPNTAGLDVTAPDPPRDLVAVPIDTALDLTWSPNSEHDLAGYKIHYGISTGNYESSVEVGNVTQYRLEDLANDVPLYVAVSSFDISGNESDKSEEVSAVPQLSLRSKLQYQSGWPVSVDHDLYSSPALYDIDGDGKLEISISAKDGKVYLLNYGGSDVPGWPVSTDSGCVSSPALGDLDGDGRVEVAVGAGEMVYMWHDDGTLMTGWPVKTDGSVLASPALGDINGDGSMEVVIGSRDSRLYAYNSDGSFVDGWPVKMYGGIRCSVALADIDGDSRSEIVVGSEAGNVYILKGDGTRASGWPVYVGSAVYSSPALGDINGDGRMEVVAADKDGRIHAWRYDGGMLSGWPVDLHEEIVSSPALGDIDGDRSSLEIVIGTESGSVYVLESDGSIMDGWPVVIADTMTSSPALGDINGDGNAEVIVATSNGWYHVGLVYAFSNTGRRISPEWPVYIRGNIEYSSPALGDLDGDGDIELIAGSCRPDRNSGGQIHVWDLMGSLTEGGIPWSAFRHDSQHTGVADPPLILPPQKPEDIQVVEPSIPGKSLLLPNYPNPFSEETWIPYNLAKSGSVLIRIYNVSGQLVKTMDLGHRDAGYYEVKEQAARWDVCNENGEPVSSGVYFYQIIAGHFRDIRKMVLIKH